MPLLLAIGGQMCMPVLSVLFFVKATQLVMKVGRAKIIPLEGIFDQVRRDVVERMFLVCDELTKGGKLCADVLANFA
ncbi:hypothetical protein HBI23_080600 [Parastagonospora nodorum]|nr:hypothetical protein HBH44_241430 [Parastagonospora nodorum]KAH5664522.1 hypothetical protein HBI23_080600 [Parastagonospora nodorum]